MKKSALIVIPFFALLFSTFYFLNKIEKMRHNQILFAEFLGEVQAKQDFYSTNFELNMKMTGLSAPEVDCMVSQREKEWLSEMGKDRPLLIYRFSRSNCQTCYTDALTALQAELPEDSFEWVRILTSWLIERELLILKRTYDVKIPVYIIPPKSFDWPVEEMNVPYFFVLHPDMTISHIFLPNKDYPEVSRQYFEGIKRLLIGDK